ncbi:hypothetical protein [Treponema pedis]|uniref:hypothetical protein n=1 Tax=Treponema pedis TaxID=409322 RepID=UPI00040DEF7E|nr:hypothetical protein [Treponema pedis]
MKRKRFALVFGVLVLTAGAALIAGCKHNKMKMYEGKYAGTWSIVTQINKQQGSWSGTVDSSGNFNGTLSDDAEPGKSISFTLTVSTSGTVSGTIKRHGEDGKNYLTEVRGSIKTGNVSGTLTLTVEGSSDVIGNGTITGKKQ